MCKSLGNCNFAKPCFLTVNVSQIGGSVNLAVYDLCMLWVCPLDAEHAENSANQQQDDVEG